MRRAAAVFAAAIAGACSLRAPRVSGSSPCASNRECDPTNVCYLGECRGGASALTQVAVEVRPPNDSQLALLQRGGIDLHTAVADFELEPLVSVPGSVQQAQDADGGLAAVAGAVVTFTNHSPAIPDRVERITVASDQSGGFTARLSTATWDALVEPPSPLPPRRFPALKEPATGPLLLPLPRVGELSRVSGTLAAGGVPLDGARVVALDASGQPVAAPAISADGGFELLLPPSAPAYKLQVGPGAAPDGGPSPANSLAAAPLPNFAPFDPTFTSAGTIAKSFDALPPPAILRGVVVDSAGAGVPGARVYASSVDPTGYTLSRACTANASGAFSLTLREGTYEVEAAPDTAGNAPAVSAPKLISLVAASPPLQLLCPHKARALGYVVRPDGSPAGEGYQVTATRLPDHLITSRVAYSTPTDSAGLFHVIGDAGLYRIEIAPPAGTALPRKIIQVELTGDGAEVALPVIQISPPLQVLGTVRGRPPGGLDAPVAGAIVDFFALDVAGVRAIYLGSGVTDLNGHYRAVLPDVPQPGLMP